MADAIDFGAIMGELSQFQNEIERGTQTLTNPKEKEVMLDLIQKIQRSRAQVEDLWPSTMGKMDSEIRRMKAEAEAQLAGMDSKRAKIDAVGQQMKQAKAAAAKAKVKAPKPVEAKVDLTLGAQLQQELLARFAPGADAEANTTQLREIWEDWNWPGGKSSD